MVIFFLINSFSYSATSVTCSNYLIARLKFIVPDGIKIPWAHLEQNGTEQKF